MTPAWFHELSIAFVSLGLLCAAIIAADILCHPQHMWIMDIVWPVTALFGTVWILWQYFRCGRLATHQKSSERDVEPPNQRQIPFEVMVSNGTLHCGAGCTLGDLCAEWLIFSVPAVAAVFGWHWLFREKLFAEWGLDFLIAFTFGIVFQYFTIAPMRGLSLGPGLVAAIKADTVSIMLWQIGMYGFMAIAHFAIFGIGFRSKLQINSFEFWFMMQIAMAVGFITAYPANWWLIKRGFKEKM